MLDEKLRDQILAGLMGYMTDEEMLALLATDGMLVKRPILVTDETVIPGFRAADWEAALK